ncbi:MAG: heavy metal translocating P-type ATPase metal-binding domain-containing protein [Bacteroidetes bacterium]|nr:heavy metal translocating P-type ATPase metal-binding domain-containing protein [Bacteroidota bacterium]
MRENTIYTETQYYHCGENCKEESVEADNKSFCCQGCKLVYELLQENNLCSYYDLQASPGKTQAILGDRYAYLDQSSIADKLILFKEGDISHIQFHIPAMHCASCIWLLEHMNRLDAGIISSKTNFIQKELHIIFDHTKTSLRNVVEKLHEIAYPPELNLKELEKGEKKALSKSRIYKIGIAGFVFGNIMLLSFPEYFSSGIYEGDDFHVIFGYLNLLLSLPVFFYSASEFLENALMSFRQKVINIDVPIAIGIVAMFLRSIYEVVSDTGPGYFDSMTGLVFFMLIGRNFQSKTYEWLSFERDYKSYFPIAVTRLKGTEEEVVSVHDIKPNDRLFIRNQEIIPADVLLVSQKAQVDYSFVTGESREVTCQHGERIFAGARLVGKPAEVLVQKDVSHSYITKLWNQSSGKSESKSKYAHLTESISKWFVIVTMSIAVGSLLYWYPTDPSRAMLAFTSVLVIACACALALSAPFTFGNMIRILGKRGIYLKNTKVLEQLSNIDTVVFDKTGTLTSAENYKVEYVGIEPTDLQKQLIASLAHASSHPFSRMLSTHLSSSNNSLPITNLKEINGKGIEGLIQGNLVQLGSRSFIHVAEAQNRNVKSSEVGVSIDGKLLGYFYFKTSYRKSATTLLHSLKNEGYKISVMSGDYSFEQTHLEELLEQKEGIHFEQKPIDKLNSIKEVQSHGKKVMMIGDGLNDAGALMQSDVGLAIAEDINNFTPGSDGIILSKNFGQIGNLLRYAKAGHRIIIISFIISILYNLVGLWFAVQGTLSPIIAAILMPISTSSLVVYTVLASSIKARRLGLTKMKA